MKRYAYSRTGLLAINPRAFTELFSPVAGESLNERRADAEILDISGPLDRHAGWWCDSYDAIRERFDAAIASDCKHIVLRIDSPGGDATGCFELAREMREKATAAGKALVSYVDGQACSAAYALACAGSIIAVPPTGFVGSIGVLSVREDSSAALAAHGTSIAYIASGKRKADGQPFKALSEAELIETQATVDSLAELFFALVQDMRGTDAAPLEARQFHGQKAVAAGLADVCQSFDELLASLAGGTGEKIMAAKGLKSARDALGEAAKGDDDDARKARRALDALDASEEETPAEEPAEEEPAAAAASAEQPAEEEPAAAAASASATLEQRFVAMEQRLAQSDVRAFLATRPDLSPAFLASVEGLPLAQVKKIVNATPKPNAAGTNTAKTSPAASAVVKPTVAPAGAGSPNQARLPAAESADLSLRMGLSAVASTGVEQDALTLRLGVPVAVAKKGG